MLPTSRYLPTSFFRVHMGSTSLSTSLNHSHRCHPHFSEAVVGRRGGALALGILTGGFRELRPEAYPGPMDAPKERTQKEPKCSEHAKVLSKTSPKDVAPGCRGSQRWPERADWLNVAQVHVSLSLLMFHPVPSMSKYSMLTEYSNILSSCF